jgi:hypothetical protein
MNDSTIDDCQKLRFEFYKNLGTLTLAAAGGEITLLNTVFLAVKNKSLAFASIACLILACMAAHGAQEALINRLSPTVRFQHWLTRLALTPRLRSLEAQGACEIASAALFGIGLALFAGFMI